MEGKAVLFKRFADVDGIDLEVDTKDVDEFVNCVRFLGPTFGGINLEDIKAPECFIIEQRLRELMDIPVFHDDQHGTAIIAAAGLINALRPDRPRPRRHPAWWSTAPAPPAIACVELIKAMGMPHDNVILCDTKGVIYQGRTERHEPVEVGARRRRPRRARWPRPWKAPTCSSASRPRARSPQRWSKSMAAKPIIFAMANPDPEITPEEAQGVRADAIIATGRSDYPNQVNNVLGFPYIFRGALDVRASHHQRRDEDRRRPRDRGAGARGRAGRGRRRLSRPAPALRPRIHHPGAVRPAPDHRRAGGGRQGGDGDRRRAPADRRHRSATATSCASRLDPDREPDAADHRGACGATRAASSSPRARRRRSSAPRSPSATAGYGTPVLIGREERIAPTHARRSGISRSRTARDPQRPPVRAQPALRRLPLPPAAAPRAICSATASAWSTRTATCSRRLHGGAAATPTPWSPASPATTTRRSRTSAAVIDPQPGSRIFGLTMMMAEGRTVFIADTTVHELPDTERRWPTSRSRPRAKARAMGHEPRVALAVVLQFRQPAARARLQRDARRGGRARPAPGRFRV